MITERKKGPYRPVELGPQRLDHWNWFGLSQPVSVRASGALGHIRIFRRNRSSSPCLHHAKGDWTLKRGAYTEITCYSQESCVNTQVHFVRFHYVTLLIIIIKLILINNKR